MMKSILLFAILLGFCSAPSNESNHGPDEDASGNPRISWSAAGFDDCSLHVDDCSTIVPSSPRSVPSSRVSEAGDNSDEEGFVILPKTLTLAQRLALLAQVRHLLYNIEIARQEAIECSNLDLMYRASSCKERALALQEALFVSPGVVEIESNEAASRMESLMQYMSAIKANSAEKLRSCKEKLQPGFDLLNEYSAELLSWFASKSYEGISFAGEKAGEGLSLAGNKAAEGLNFAGQAVSGLAADAGDALLSFIKEQILDPRDASEVRNRVGENFGELVAIGSETGKDITNLWINSLPLFKKHSWDILYTVYSRLEAWYQNYCDPALASENSPQEVIQSWPISSNLGSILGITAYNSFWTAYNTANGIRKSVIPAGRFSYNLTSLVYKKISALFTS